MKYFKIGEQIFAFEEDGSQDHWIRPDMVKLTDDEIDRLENPEKHMTVEEKRNLYLSSLKPLDRRQLKTVLLKNKLLDKVPSVINGIEDYEQKMLAQIEWEDSIEFKRLSPSLNNIFKLMGLKESQIDALWEEGLKL